MLEPRVVAELKAVVGGENFTDNLIDLVSYSYDALGVMGRPEAAAWVQTTDQVSRILKIANREKFPVIPRAAGTGIAGMAVPVKGGLVLDVLRMNKILQISPQDRLCVVQPGVIYSHLQKRLGEVGFFFPPEPGSTLVCAIGGNVATNAGGLKGAKYGTTKDYVLGLEVVLADGRVMRIGGRTMKTSSGYDLTHLLVGSEGTLGVVTEITLKIQPLPQASATALACFDRLEDAGQAVTEIMSSGVIPSVLEIMGRYLIRAINQNTDLGLPEVDTMLLVETDGFTKADAEAQMAKVLEVFRKNNAGEIKQARTPQEAAELWTARKSTYPVVARINNDIVVEDVTVPLSRLVELFRGFNQIVEKHGLTVATCAHAGDGNFHPLITFDGQIPGEYERIKKASSELFKLAIDLGGTLTGEHGIGLTKAKYMALEHDPVSLEMMRAIKRTFDPNNILNPGKMALDD